MAEPLAGRVVSLGVGYRVRSALFGWRPPPRVQFRPGTFRHPKGYVFLPSTFFRMSVERFDLGAEVLPPDATAGEIGRALEAVIRRSEWNCHGITRRDERFFERGGSGAFAGQMRTALGLSKSAALWSRMDYVGVVVDDGRITLTATENMGRSGFDWMTPGSCLMTQWPETPERLGALLSLAFGLCR